MVIICLLIDKFNNFDDTHSTLEVELINSKQIIK